MLWPRCVVGTAVVEFIEMAKLRKRCRLTLAKVSTETQNPHEVPAPKSYNLYWKRVIPPSLYAPLMVSRMKLKSGKAAPCLNNSQPFSQAKWTDG